MHGVGLGIQHDVEPSQHSAKINSLCPLLLKHTSPSSLLRFFSWGPVSLAKMRVLGKNLNFVKSLEAGSRSQKNTPGDLLTGFVVREQHETVLSYHIARINMLHLS